ncbi:SCP2 domain-containing protein [Pseudomonas sp. C27(2019)]|uniref:ubiquinone anaerobic biosynthesis accessory factor UbiT n=1 Tax=Pseudomonas sp. C27(2019) TaxID=2604941 RepID=UPI001244BF43|nr:SCP2 sterol-binding domain-containing protein [Pseudomonas sp. C27(2019)]QEY58641.1 SCP2 domain-containing protein [Pseudomonas sp. C27(2019)]
MLSRAAPFLLSAGDRVLPLATHLPFFVQRLALQRSLNQVFAHAMQDGLFDVLESRWMRLQVSDLNLSWCLSKDPHSNRLLIKDNAPAEVTISGNWREFLLLASRQEDPDTLFFRRRLQIDGDTELGLAVKNMIDSLDSDDLPSWLWKTIETLGKEAMPAAS